MADGNAVKIFQNQGKTIVIVKNFIGLYNAIEGDRLYDFILLLESGHLGRVRVDCLQGLDDNCPHFIFFSRPVDNGAFCLFELLNDMVIFYLFHGGQPFTKIYVRQG